MKFILHIINTEKEFRVKVYHGKDVIAECGWHGTEFKYNGKWYAVFGPYHSLDGDRFRLYELNPVSDPS